MGADISEAPQPASCFESLDAVVIGNELEAMVGKLADHLRSLRDAGQAPLNERPPHY